MIEIPHTRLNADTLKAVIEEFILRDGTDYGAHEVTLDAKQAQVLRQLERGDVLITFDPRTENCTLLTRQQFKRTMATETVYDEESSSPREAYEDYAQDTCQGVSEGAMQEHTQDFNQDLNKSMESD